MGLKDDRADTQPEGNKDIRHRGFKPAGSEEGDRGVNQNKVQTHLGRPGAQIGDLELIRRAETQEGIDHQTAHPQRHKPHQFVINSAEKIRPADKHRAHKNKVQKVVHEEAPLNQSRILEPPDGPVKAVRKPLQKDHRRRCPQPVQVSGFARQVSKPNHPQTPQYRQQRQLPRFDPCGKARRQPLDKTLLNRRQR